MTEHVQNEHKQQDDSLSTFASVVGLILGISYPVLALSTGARALYQLLLKEGVVNYVGPGLTAVAATLYIIAAVGFAKRERWAWRLSVSALGVETLLTLIVGTLSLVIPETIGSTVWRHFGADYGYFPLIQPLLGLAWLLHPQILRAYGIRGLRTADN